MSIQDEPDDSRYFALGPTTPEYGDALAKLDQIRQLNPNSHVVIGGPHAEHNVTQCLADGFDVIATGDGENITIDTFRAAGRVSLPRKPLDDYPMIDRSLLDIRQYCYQIGGRNATTLTTSRGCPYRCGFCAKTERGTRHRSPREIETEVDYLHDDLGYRALMFFDDTLIIGSKRILEICRVLKERGILWRCFVRGDLVVRYGQDLVETMHRSGCVEVGIGIESGSDRILANINKGETTDTIRKAITVLSQVGICVKGFFILGLPGESQESIEETRRFVAEAHLDDADFTVYQPYRGSPIWANSNDYDISWDEQIIKQQFYKGRSGEYNCIVSTSSLTAQEIARARDSLEEQFKCR